jgi:hypothetical protein
MKRFRLWCKNDDIYYLTKAEAMGDLEPGDRLARVLVEGRNVKELICDLLNHDSVIADEVEVEWERAD